MEAYQKFLQEIILEFSKEEIQEEDTNLKKRVIRGLGISPK